MVDKKEPLEIEDLLVDSGMTGHPPTGRFAKGPPAATNERVPFRLLKCPECMHQMCWVNHRLPTYCPECGRHIYIRLRTEPEHTLKRADAWLRIEDAKPPVVEKEVDEDRLGFGLDREPTE